MLSFHTRALAKLLENTLNSNGSDRPVMTRGDRAVAGEDGLQGHTVRVRRQAFDDDRVLEPVRAQLS